MAMKKSSFNMIPDDISGTTTDPVVSTMPQPASIINDNNIKPVQQEQQIPVSPIAPVTPIVQIQQTQSVQAAPAPRKRIYVYITEEHYKHVKRECGATDTTIQDYFDKLIEKEMTENEHHYR